MAGSLYYVWGLIEGLQIVASMGLFDAKVPANVGSFLESFSSLASFDLIDTTALLEAAIYLPEKDAFTVNY